MLGKAYRKVSFLSFSDFRLPIEIDEEEGQSPIEDREKTWERASNELPVGMTFFVRFDTRTTQNRISPIIRLVSELFYRNFIQYTRDAACHLQLLFAILHFARRKLIAIDEI